MKLTIAVGAVIVAILLTVLIVVILTRVVDWRPSPATVVESYLDAIADGDATAANSLFNPLDIGDQYLPDGLVDRTSFMSDAALGSATERITDIEIGLVSRSTGTDGAVVFFRYAIAGERYDEAINLKWRNGEWQLVTGLFQTLRIRPAFERAAGSPEEVLEVRLGDATADSNQLVIQGGSLIAYPGVYPLTLEAPGWSADGRVAIPHQVGLVTPHEMVLVTARYILASKG